MAAKKKITREKILKEAVEIVRQSGIAALNMRTLAQACKCSTQPIYLSFEGTEELKRAVANEALGLFNCCIKDEIASGKYPEYKAVGMGYVRFAKEEKQLFKFLFMGDGIKLTGRGDDSFETSVFLIMKNYGLYKGDARKLHFQMWVVVHGIASMFVSGHSDWVLEDVSELLTDAYNGFMKNLEDEKNDNRN